MVAKKKSQKKPTRTKKKKSVSKKPLNKKTARRTRSVSLSELSNDRWVKCILLGGKVRAIAIDATS